MLVKISSKRRGAGAFEAHDLRAPVSIRAHVFKSRKAACLQAKVKTGDMVGFDNVRRQRYACNITYVAYAMCLGRADPIHGSTGVAD